MFDIWGLIQQAAQTAASQVGDAIGSVISNISSGVSNYVVKPLSNDINNVLGQIGSSVDALGNAASSGITNTLNAVGNTLGNVEAQVVNGFTTGLGAVQQGISGLAGTVSSAFGSIVQGIGSGFSTLENGVTGAFKTYGAALENVLGKWGEAFNAVFVKVFQPVAHFIENLPADIVDIAGKLVKGVEALYGEDKRIADSIVRYVDKVLVPDIANGVKTEAFNLAKVALEGITTEVVTGISEISGLKVTDLDLVTIPRIVGVAVLEQALGTLEAIDPSAAFIVSQLIAQITGSILRPPLRNLEQAANAMQPNEMLPLGTLLDGTLKGVVSKDVYYSESSKAGLSKERADLMLASAQTMLGVGELVALYRRGTISSKGDLYAEAAKVRASARQVDGSLLLYDRLLNFGEAIEMWRRGVLPKGWHDAFEDAVREGYTPERLEAIKEISYTLPSLLTEKEFIYREADNDTIASKYGYDAGLTPAFYEKAKRLGYQEADAKKLYRSSWQFPPFFLLVSEYKTGKIKEQDFLDLLKFQGFTEYWSKAFADSLKPTLTVADVKDLYKYQVISAEEIVPKLVSLGQPIDLAEEYKTLWLASIKLAAPLDKTGAQVTSTKIKEDTQSLIMTAYKDGVISKNAAQEKLVAINESADAASLLIAIADYEITQKRVKEVYALDKQQYVSGAIDVNTVINDLTGAGATADQLTLYLDEITRVSHAKPKAPTLAEFEKWYKDGIISLAQFAKALTFLGYSDVWIPFYLAVAGASAKKITALGFNMNAAVLQ